MTESARVLKFITAFHIGGTERQFVAVARGLSRPRFDVRLACLHRQGPFLEEVEQAGLPVREYSIRGLCRPHAFRRQLTFTADLRREPIDLIHTYGFYPNTFALPAARLAGVRLRVASIRDTGEWWSPAQRRVQRLVCRLAHRVLVNAQAVADRLVQEGYERRRITVIPNGIDLARFDGRPGTGVLRRELGIPPTAPVVAVVARLNEVRGIDLKGIPDFLEAAAGVARQHDGARFLVVGDGPRRPGLERTASRLGLDGRIVFTGFRHDIPELLSEVDVAVLPSVAEALSNSILEAMAAGLPVVTTRVGGNPEAVVDGVTGLIVPPARPDDLGRAICLLLSDPELRRRLGRSGWRRVLERFSLDRMLAATTQVYDQLRLEADGARHRRAGTPGRWHGSRTTPADAGDCASGTPPA